VLLLSPIELQALNQGGGGSRPASAKLDTSVPQRVVIAVAARVLSRELLGAPGCCGPTPAAALGGCGDCVPSTPLPAPAAAGVGGPGGARVAAPSPLAEARAALEAGHMWQPPLQAAPYYKHVAAAGAQPCHHHQQQGQQGPCPEEPTQDQHGE
jgi:hypothetical protein